jgi:LysM repeat protein
VIAKKREELLKGGDSDLYLDAAGPRYKRRTSDDFGSNSAPPVQSEERDSLVYIHHVSTTDTLPGISIKFNCPLPTIKKANRLWSNDGIHSRKTLAIPLDACNVKGRRVAGPEAKGKDFLTEPELDYERRCSSDTIKPSRIPASPPDGHEDFVTISSSKSADENPWTHDSWILLENQTVAIEIARMSRQDLGFFPRARRKSVSYSDLDTPSESFDLPRPSITISDTSVTPERTFQHKSRRSSSSHAFAPKMLGPGGVGTLGGKGPSAPGPGEDKFSKALQRALPKFNTQPTFDELDEQRGSGSTTPIYNIENVGSTIEGWVRNIAHKAAKVVEPPSPNIKRGIDTGIRGGAGDLIELEDAIDLGGEDDSLPDPAMFDDEPHRGRGSRRATGSSIEDQRKAVVARNLMASRKKGD